MVAARDLVMSERPWPPGYLSRLELTRGGIENKALTPEPPIAVHGGLPKPMCCNEAHRDGTIPERLSALQVCGNLGIRADTRSIVSLHKWYWLSGRWFDHVVAVSLNMNKPRRIPSPAADT